MYSPLYFSQTRGLASAAEPPGCSSPSLSLLDTATAILLTETIVYIHKILIVCSPCAELPSHHLLGALEALAARQPLVAQLAQQPPQRRRRCGGTPHPQQRRRHVQQQRRMASGGPQQRVEREGTKNTVQTATATAAAAAAAAAAAGRG